MVIYLFYFLVLDSQNLVSLLQIVLLDYHFLFLILIFYVLFMYFFYLVSLVTLAR